MTNIQRNEIDNVFAASGVEFDKWANLENLNNSERHIINKYFQPEKSMVEAGTGGGRIVIEMHELGFTNLTGFDLIPEMIEAANRRKGDINIKFDVEDATCLSYPSESFDQAFYSQQIMSIIPGEENRMAAFTEAARILKPNGIIAFGLLCFDVRVQKKWYLPYLAYLSLFRKLTGSNKPIQSIPWLIHDRKPQLSAFLDNGDQIYWYKLEEIVQIFHKIGLELVSLGTRQQIEAGFMCESLEEISKLKMDGALYLVARKNRLFTNSFIST